MSSVGNDQRGEITEKNITIPQLPAGKVYHCFLAHNCSNGNHARVSRINQALIRRGFLTWFDGECLNGSLIQSQMAEGIYQSATFLTFITEEYERKINSQNALDNCFFEFNVAATCDIANYRIAVAMETKMINPRDWKLGLLKAHLGGVLTIDLTSDEEAVFEKKMDILASNINVMLGNSVCDSLPNGIPPVPGTESFSTPTERAVSLPAAPTEQLMETTIPSQEQEIDRFIGEIQSQTKTIQESYRKLLGEHQPFSKEILLLGETGVGKSTFLSWLLSSREHPLFAEERDDGRLVLKNHAHHSLVIGHGSTSGTLCATPIAVADPRTGKPMIIWDCPGFKDVRGTYHDIKHMAGVSDVLSLSSNRRIIAVIEENKHLSCRSNDFIDFCNEFVQSFCANPEEYAATCLLITKTMFIRKFDVALRSYINDKTNSLQDSTRQWLSYIVENSRFLTMSQPINDGPFSQPGEAVWNFIDSLMDGYAKLVFNPVLSAQSLLYLNCLSNCLNGKITEIFQKNKKALAENFIAFIQNMTDTSHCELTTKIASIKSTVDIRQPVMTLEELSQKHLKELKLFFPKAQQGSDQGELDAYCQVLHTLSSLLDGLKTARGVNVNISFELHKWLIPLEEFRNHIATINAHLHHAKQTLAKVKQSETIVREWKTFDCLPEIIWRKKQLRTFIDLKAKKIGERFENNDEKKVSIRIERYELDRENGVDSVPEPWEFPVTTEPILYVPSSEKITLLPATANTTNLTVEFELECSYRRPDNSIYTKKEICRNSLTEGKKSFVHNDGKLESQEMIELSTTYKNKVYPLPSYEKRRVPYSLEGDEIVTPLLPTINHTTLMINVQVDKRYKRPDSTTLIKTDTQQNKIQEGKKSFVHNDGKLESQEMVELSTTYKNKVYPLPSYEKRRVPYQLQEEKELKRIENLKTLSVQLEIESKYKRPDNSFFLLKGNRQRQLTGEESARLQKAEQERLAAEKKRAEEQARLAREKAEREARERAQQERLRRQEEERERIARMTPEELAEHRLARYGGIEEVLERTDLMICAKCQSRLRKHPPGTWGNNWTCDWPSIVHYAGESRRAPCGHTGLNRFSSNDVVYGCDSIKRCNWGVCEACVKRFSLKYVELSNMWGSFGCDWEAYSNSEGKWK